ncbi:MAG: hemerythrin domain-containing protein [Candidatus Koribacter versatilis]|uniref:Hemerythrin domain-containing protein n=1 Tax=Candidatus Korobacter versatilis TaxID=658062 RepID=A0A932EPP9_9BACT|nr:hemerythrin domain-containing protein [Candidatus Koribacter versatilis]
MRRDPALIPLSQQHHDALALCVYIERAAKSGHLDLAHWNREVAAAWQSEIRWHFQAEEEVVFPAAQRVSELRLLVEGLLVEHAELRRFFDSGEKNALTAPDLHRFRERLHDHVRKEERQLFPPLQTALPPEELTAIGAALQAFFERHTGGPACAMRHPQPQAKP